jgi:ribosome-associated protein
MPSATSDSKSNDGLPLKPSGGSACTRIRKRKANPINAKQTLDKIVGVLEDRKAENIVTIDVRGRSSLTDAIVIASCTSTPHLKAVAGRISREIKKEGGTPIRMSGDAESAWIVIDLFDVFVHLFLPEAREYYDLESLWRKKA